LSEVERIFPCIICGRSWTSVQGLRGHMKRHKNEFMRTSIHVRRELWSRFESECKRHKTTTCALLDVLVKAVLEGSGKGVVDLSRIGSPQPLIINVNEYFLGRPRSPYKVEVPAPEGLIVSGEGAGSNSAGVTLKGSDFGGVRGCRRRGLPPPDPEWMKRQLEIT